MLTKRQAIGLYGSVKDLAAALNRTRAAIYMWRDDRPIPKNAELRLRYELKPESFDANGALVDTSQQASTKRDH